MADSLTSYYEYVQHVGNLRTPAHARRWSHGVLQTLGLNLSRSARRNLARALPSELAQSLTDVFWLAHFRNTNLSALEFQNAVARRCGNSDKEFAFYPVRAVFGGVQQLVSVEVARSVADSLSPELRAIWHAAPAMTQPVTAGGHLARPSD